MSTQPRTSRWMPWALCLLAGWLSACSSGPPVPEWQGDAHAAQQHAYQAELEGNQRVALVEWRRARQAVTSTGRPDWLARLELSRCAVRQASLDLQPCDAFTALQRDVAPAELAYQRYLLGTPTADDVALLPAIHQPLAQALARTPAQGATVQGRAWEAYLRQQQDPMARLVAASVMLRARLADAAVLQLAVDTASEQGWRRALLAWLTVQAEVARQTGQPTLAEQIERRRSLLVP